MAKFWPLLVRKERMPANSNFQGEFYHLFCLKIIWHLSSNRRGFFKLIHCTHSNLKMNWLLDTLFLSCTSNILHSLLGIRLLCIFGRAQNTFIMIFVCMHRGVSVDEKGYIYVADSGNNRIQIFNPDGTFLRCFGRWGQVNIFQSSRERAFFPCNMVPRVLKISF